MPTLPNGTPEWLVFLVVVGFGLRYALQFLSEASESAAKILGPLGRRWRERGAQRMRERAIADGGELTAVTTSRDFHRKRADDAERDNRHFMNWYNQQDQPFHRDVSISAAEKGCELPPWGPLSEYPREPSGDPGDA